MTRDDIIRMAREASGGTTWWPIHVDILERFAALVAAAERERIKAERQSHIYSKPPYTNGCPVCRLGADGNAMGYCCNRGDCPRRITRTGAV